MSVLDYMSALDELAPKLAKAIAAELVAKDEQIAALRERVEKLLWVVKRLEYIEESDEFLICPICRNEKPAHYEDCELAAALQEAQ